MDGGWKPVIAVLVILILSIPVLSIDTGEGSEDSLLPVNLLGGRTFDTIQGAVDAASDGDVILLRDGVYSAPLVVDKEVKIIGEGTAAIRTTPIKVVGSGGTYSNIQFQDIDNGFTYGGAIYQSRDGLRWEPDLFGGLTVQDCSFTRCSRGIYIFSSIGSLIQRCTFEDCDRGITIDPHLNPIENIYCSYNRIFYCDFKNISYQGPYEGECVMINQSSYDHVAYCNMDNNAFGVVAYRATQPRIEKNTITNTTRIPIYMYETRAHILDNVIRDNNWNLDIRKSSSTLIKGNKISNNTGPIYINQCSGTCIQDNEIDNDSIMLRYSTSSLITGNRFTASETQTFEFVTTTGSHYAHNIASSNTVGGNPIRYEYNKAAPSFTNTTAGSFIFAHCTQPSVTGGNVTDGDGILLINSPGASITTNLTNCLLGIDAVDSPNGRIEGCRINTSDRGTTGIRLLGSTGTEVWNTTIETPLHETPAWMIEGGDTYSCYNTSFDYFDVTATENSGGNLKVYGHLEIRVLANETLAPMEGVDAQLIEDDTTWIHRTAHFQGSADGTDAAGELGPFLLLDREYKHNSIPEETDHVLDLWIEVDAEWLVSNLSINMSVDRLLEFETADIWKPQMPLNFNVTDMPDEDSINVSWDINTDDTQVYTVYTNASGDWVIMDNVTSPLDNLIVDEGIVHGGTYHYAISAWDEVPLESNWTEVVSVVHEDGVVPEVPTGLRATEVNGTNLTLVWDTNLDLDLAGYRIYINATGGDDTGPWVEITPAMGLLDPGLWVTGLTSETTYHFVVTAFDERPNESSHSLVLTVTTLDITPPEAPVLETLPEFTNVAVPTITGTAEPGSTLILFLNGEVYTTLTVGPSGEFDTDVTLVDGINVIIAWATDASDNTGHLSAEIGTILDQEAPLAPRLDTLPELTNVVEQTVSGTAEALSQVTVFINGEVVSTADVGPDGTFELQLDLVEGENLITAHATDRALNTGPQATALTVVLDTIAPGVPEMSELPEYTNEKAHTIEGVAEAGSLVEILVNGEVSAKVDADDGGAFKFSLIIEDRETVIAIRAVDLAGNVGDLTSDHTIIIDQEPPEAVAGVDLESIVDTEATLDASGSSDNEAILSYIWTFELDGVEVTLDGETAKYTFPDVVTLTVTLTVTDLAGNTGEDTLAAVIVPDNKPPVLSGDEMTPNKGSTDTKFKITVEFRDEDGEIGTVFVVIDSVPYPMIPDPDDDDTADGQEFTLKIKLDAGEHTYYFTGKDSFGNDAVGSSVGEDNSQSTPDVTQHKVEDTPGAWSLLTLMAVVSVCVLRRLRLRRGYQ